MHEQYRVQNQQTHEPRRNRGPKGYVRSDERILDDIASRLDRLDAVDSADVAVRVHHGHVTLEGSVPERWMRYAIEDEVDRCSGVQDIDNNVSVRDPSLLVQEDYRGRGSEESMILRPDAGTTTPETNTPEPSQQ